MKTGMLFAVAFLTFIGISTAADVAMPTSITYNIPDVVVEQGNILDVYADHAQFLAKRKAFVDKFTAIALDALPKQNVGRAIQIMYALDTLGAKDEAVKIARAIVDAREKRGIDFFTPPQVPAESKAEVQKQIERGISGAKVLLEKYH